MKTVLVTGGVKGIGRSIVKKFFAKGDFVIANYSKSNFEATALEAELSSDRFRTVKFDLSDPEQIQRSIQSIQNEIGSIDVLVNNAGVTFDDLLIRLPSEKIEKIIRINLLGAIY
ncbi:MAG: SDR family NAD(P)-dependent oxidoreductase, partial [Deltaproteobacteria bacterium]|nr:SDR family NAD(P)-dependent oxidoreductase [Deltaproteobacteria bacterium]